MHYPNIPTPRAAVAAVLLVGLVATSGCSWFRKTDELYAQAPENRPLEVPPDLDRPNTGGTAASGGSVTASEAAANASASAAASAPSSSPAPGDTASGFTTSGSRDEVFARVDTALADMEGVTVASRAQLLGAFDVNYQGSNFLVRVSDANGGAQVSAVDPRGMPASGPAPQQLMAQLRTALGAQ
jgi:hypothetical protein